MDKQAKREYKSLKKIAKQDQIKTHIVPDEDGQYTNGFTLAYGPMLPGAPDCKMLAVAVSYCAKPDTFKKKIGKLQALRNMYQGGFVQLPLAKDLTKNPADVRARLEDMFFI